MVIRLIAVDRVRSPQVAAICAELRKRLGPLQPYEETEVRAGDGSDPAAATRTESARILQLLRGGEQVWLVERTGTQLSSLELAARLADVGNSGAQRLTLVVAGTYGAGAALRERADFLWSLSELTFLHEWARAIVLEQLYRAAKIARNEPYHH